MNNRLILLFILSFGFFLTTNCGLSDSESLVKFDSAHSIALDGHIENGQIRTLSNKPTQIKTDIKDQLIYIIGQLNGIDGVIDSSKNKISIQNIEDLPNGEFLVSYKAEIFVAWARELIIPEQYELILPAYGHWEGREVFYDQYGQEDGEDRCFDWSAHDMSLGIYWYYYRPQVSSCSLRDSDLDDPEVVTRFSVKLKISDQNTEGKSPEYEKIWEDGSLIITSIFGQNEPDANRSDPGVRSYGNMYRQLIGQFGQPFETDFDAGDGKVPGLDSTEVNMKFRVEAGVVEAHLFLIEGIRSVGSGFIDRYNELSKVSDFVAYSGHSGLGANIRAMARMGEFVQGQYQIFLINGCDTFAYVDDSLKEAHARANPGEGRYRYFDIMTNAMPSYFHSNVRSNMTVIKSLVLQDKTYREILSGFDKSQRAVVGEEQDNVWPEPFETSNHL